MPAHPAGVSTLEINGARIHVELTGKGDPVVLFKGEWQLETCSKNFPNTRFVELGIKGPQID